MHYHHIATECRESKYYTARVIEFAMASNRNIHSSTYTVAVLFDNAKIVACIFQYVKRVLFTVFTVFLLCSLLLFLFFFRALLPPFHWYNALYYRDCYPSMKILLAIIYGKFKIPFSKNIFPVNGSNQITENRINDNDEQRNNQIGNFIRYLQPWYTMITNDPIYSGNKRTLNVIHSGVTNGTGFRITNKKKKRDGK